MVITRVYPIRKTRNSWDIPINCINEYGIYKTEVNLAVFDIEDPECIDGTLYNPDEIVIPDRYFSVDVVFPLTNPVNTKIEMPNKDGCSLAEIIAFLSILYRHIYNEEEKTSSQIEYEVKDNCRQCNHKNIEDYVTYDKKKIDCSICCDDTGNNTTNLKCNHSYHTKCIFKWFETSKTCPLCRKNIVECSTCNGSGIIHSLLRTAVIPVHLRGNIPNRNTTNGVYGIWGYDFEDLILTNLSYNRIEKKLTINVTNN